MELVLVADRDAGLCHREIRCLQNIRSLGHSVREKESLGGLSLSFLEYLAKITPVQTDAFCDILDRNIILIISFDKGNGFMDIVIPEAASRIGVDLSVGPNEGVKKQIEMPDQMQLGFLRMFCDIQGFLFYLFPVIRQ